METFHKSALAITILGAINWLLIGLINFNLVTAMFGDTWISRIIYIVCGITGLLNIGILFNHIKPE